jgi:tetratricopeptide (TPR) repeat protein
MSRSYAPRVAGALALLLASVAMAVVSSQQLDRAAKLHRKGAHALKSGRIDKARKAFNDALAECESFPSAHIGLGQIAMSEQRFELALAHFEQARAGYAELGESLFDIRTRRYTSARSQIASLQDQVRHLETQVQGATTGRGAASEGMLRIEISKMQNAIVQLQAIEPPDPDETGEAPGEIYFYIGNALFQLDRPGEALEAWETCRAKSPRFPLVYNNLALVYARMGRLEAARTSLERAEKLGFPVDPQFKEDLEQALRDSRSPDSG